MTVYSFLYASNREQRAEAKRFGLQPLHCFGMRDEGWGGGGAPGFPPLNLPMPASQSSIIN